MHQPHAQPRPSIYFPYRVFDPWLPDGAANVEQHSVVVVGAGPIGLVTALLLARHGVRCVMLESELQVSEGSRAIAFTRRSLEILQQAGIAERVTAMGLPWRFGNSYYRGQRVFRMENPHDPNDRFAPLINIQQQYLEAFLIDEARASGLIELRWGNKLERLVADADGATLEVDTPSGPYTLRTDWLVAADGARSVVRSQMGLKMEGASYEGRFVIADIRVDLPLPTERLAFFDPDWNPGNTILMHREPHGLWRLDYQLPPNETPEEALRPASLKARIDAQLAMIGHPGVAWTLDWSSVYAARALTLPDYVHGRVAFTGDAAHLLPIFGVRGANTGFQDAQGLAWRLAMVVKGLSDPALLRSYSSERVAAAREIVDEAGKSTRFMTPPTRGFRLLRDAVLSLSLTQAFVRPLYHWRTSRPHEYGASPLNSANDDNALFSTGPGHGAPARNVILGNNDHLLDHLEHGFTLLCATGEALPDGVGAVLAEFRGQGVPISVVAVGAMGPVAGADLLIADADGALRERYGLTEPGGAYLLRPDHHVCARWKHVNAPRLAQALRQAAALLPEHQMVEKQA